MMFASFLKQLWSDREDNRYYQAQYDLKVQQIEHSFSKLKQVASQVNKQATATTKQLVRNLQLYQKRIDAIADNVDNLIIIKTINRQWTTINIFACSVLCVDKNVCIGKTNDEIVKCYPHLKQIVQVMDKMEQQVWNEKQTSKVFVSLPGHKNVQFQITIKPIETDDGVAHELVLIGHNNYEIGK